jgi:hypothetical protein
VVKATLLPAFICTTTSAWSCSLSVAIVFLDSIAEHILPPQ